MLKNTAFQDNLYQLAKIITITTEGLALELSEHIFLDKILSDISFVSKSLQSIFSEVENLSHLPEYIPIMECLHGCETDYLQLLTTFADKAIAKNFELPIAASELTALYKLHSGIKDSIESRMQETGTNLDVYRIVSKNELTELLCV